MSDTIIKATGLVKNFGKTKALDGVDLAVNAGEVFGFIGPNGAGKSTTIRILLGAIRANAGNAAIFGKDVWNDAVEIHKRIAYVPGDVNLWDNLTGGEIIDLFIRLRRGGDKKYKEELIEKFDFDPTKKAGTYSKGNRQKVALVSAFASDADLYILDEPTSGLDPLMELVFQECVHKVKREGKAVLLSSHILSEVEKLCDRLTIIRNGKIIDTGTLKELRHLSRNNVTVETKNAIEGIEKLEGVFDVANSGDEVSFKVDAEATGSVMKRLADADISHITVSPPTLEELFISHYGVKQ
ncbi:MAG: ABC transporter ATP-binding protein [Clostridiales Family XIII bacterium]|jgi:ABC-2 type transport system ATP-binding protein|nr:ABC transporter ATP-binding protein [Clostridiales Family XIII bacterium]